jgi:hypothetical protein
VLLQKALSDPGEEESGNLHPRPAFFLILQKIKMKNVGMEQANGTRRPALLRIDVRRRHAVALDRAPAHCRLRFPLSIGAKIRTRRCYNLIKS